MKKVSNWSDITVSQFIEAHQLEKDDDDYFYQFIGVIYDVSQDVIDELSLEEFDELQANLSFMAQLPTKPVNSITIHGADLKRIDDITQFTLGEWIDIENLLTQDIIANIPTVAAIVYRKQILGNYFTPDEFEPYGQYIFHRSPLFCEISMADVYGIIPKLLSFRETIQLNYTGLFGASEVEVVEEQEDYNESSIEKKERLNSEKEAKYQSKWGWDTVIYTLAKGDITKFDSIYGMPLVMALNYMSMKSELKLE